MSADDPSNWMWAQACAMIERAEQLHRQFFQPGLAAVPAVNWQPPVDVFESERGLMIVAALPGVEPNDIEVSVQPELLLVAGIRRLPAAMRGAAIQRLEIPHGRFERRIRIPAGGWVLNGSSLANGCLVLSLAQRH
jgi:HSP20 family protein